MTVCQVMRSSAVQRGCHRPHVTCAFQVVFRRAPPLLPAPQPAAQVSLLRDLHMVIIKIALGSGAVAG